MKVKISNEVGDVELWDGELQPIMIILTERDKKNIANMLPEATKYCVYPEGWSQSEIDEFMEVEDEN